MVSDKFGKRRSIRLPAWHEKYLSLWAYVKGTGETTLSQNILQATIEENQSQIENMVQDLAKSEGMGKEELIHKILTEISEE